jgi:hypothetical protein
MYPVVDPAWSAGIQGVKFLDEDRDGVRDPSELGLADWTLYLDADADGQLDPGERLTTTDASGAYRFDLLRAGVYRVGEVGRPGWVRTTPAAGFHSVSLAIGQHAAGISFGSVPVEAEFRVNRTTAGDQASPAVAVDAKGDFVIVWEGLGQDGSGWGIYAQRYDRHGRPRGVEFRVNAVTAGDQRSPAVAVDDQGDFVITWESSGAVHARRYHRNGKARGPDFLVSAGANPAIAMDRDGDFVIAWSSGAGGVYVRRYGRSGSPLGGALFVGSGSQGFQSSSSVAMDDDGDFAVAWDGWGVWVRRFTSAGTPMNTTQLDYSATSGAESTWWEIVASSPSVAMDRGGDFVVAWSRVQIESSDYSYSRNADVIAHRFSASGEPRGTQFTIADAKAPSVAAEADGDFAIAFEKSPDVWMQLDVCGWIGQDQTPPDINVQRFSATGTPQGPVLGANAVLDGSQNAPSLAIDGDGDLVVVWQSDGQDASGSGIYARRYPRTPAPLLRPSPAHRRAALSRPPMTPTPAGRGPRPNLLPQARAASDDGRVSGAGLPLFGVAPVFSAKGDSDDPLTF